MEHSAAAEDPNCGFCLQKLTYMIDPKQLPCSHVFCLPCLEEDPKKECPVCSEGYDAEWTGMKSYSPINDADDVGSSANTDHIKCDICEDQKAVCYCVECEQKLCDEHYKIHEQFRALSAAKHNHIDISVYLLNLKRYTPRPCPVHEDNSLTTACYNCRQIFCILCKPDLSSCPSDRAQFPSNSKPCHSKRPARSHDMAQLPMIATNMRSGINAQLKGIADRITERLNLEKQAWNRLHDIECDVKVMMTEVDKTVEDMIKVLNENAEKLKEGLRDYQIQHTEKVEAYSTDLRDQRDGLEDLWKTVSDMMRTYHDTEIVKECKSITDTIESAQDVTYEAQPDILKMILSKSPTLSDAITEVFNSCVYLRVPSCTDIEFKRHIDTDLKACLSIAWCGEKIVGGLSSSLMVYDVNGKKRGESELGSKGHVRVRNAGAGKLAVLKIQDSYDRELLISKIADLPSNNPIVKFDTGISQISVSSTHIAACNIDEKNIIILNIEGEQLMCLGTGKFKRPYSVFLLDSHVLVTDISNHSISKYRLEANSEPVWTCDGLQAVSGICYDKNGVIYAACAKGGRIYLISTEGVLLKELICGELENTKFIYDISISDDCKTLALACRDEGIKLFTLLHKTPHQQNKHSSSEQEEPLMDQ